MTRATTLSALICAAMMTFATAAKANDEQKTSKAEAQFEKVDHDFGFIQEKKGSVSYSFEFENIGDEPLIIVSAAASCGCTRPEFPTKPIKPGKKGKIKVTYNPVGRPGPFRKEIKVKTNGKRRTYILHIEGSVIPINKE
ncbi:MAG: DUF1573 domain-containing protein [Muribaculaceae bacterium]